MAQVSVRIEHAIPGDARTMLRLKRENILQRAERGEAPITEEERNQLRVTKANVEELASTIANSNDEDWYLVAFVRRRIEGFCRLTWRTEKNQFQFRQFYVRVSMQGQGIGNRLIHGAVGRAENSLLFPAGIFLMTGGYNTKAQAMYEHWGFRKQAATESDIKAYGDADINVLMVKEFRRSRPCDDGEPNKMELDRLRMSSMNFWLAHSLR